MTANQARVSPDRAGLVGVASLVVAYGSEDYRPDMPDEEIVSRLLALNLGRSAV